MVSEIDSDPRVAAVRAIYDASGRGDVEAALQHCSDDIVVVEDAALPWGGRYVGREGLATFTERLMREIVPGLEPLAIFRAGNHVVQYGRNRGTVRRTGVPFDIAECHIWTFAGEQVVEARFFADSSATLAALRQPSRNDNGHDNSHDIRHGGRERGAGDVKGASDV